MRSLDTLSRLYASSGRPLRKLLLCEVLALPGADPGSAELFSILHHEAESGPTVLRRHARWTLGEVLRGFVAESHGLAADASGPMPQALLDPFERSTRRLAEIYLSGESLQRMLASLAIGLLPAKSAIDRLWKSLEEKGASFAALAALAESGDQDCVDPVAELITENAVGQPDLLLLLSRLPLQATLNVVQALWDKLDVYGQGHVAWALGAHPLGSVREFARASIGSAHPFVVANALVSAGRWCDATQVDQIANAALRVEHAWVRRNAVRALAAFPATAATTQVAVHWLARGDRYAQLEALEMLAPRTTDPAVGNAVKAALESADEEVRATAMAALPASERGRDKVTALLLDQSTDVRRIAISMLSEASNDRAVEVLVGAANEDASKRVRRWAASDLARVGGEAAAKALIELSASQHAEVREAASAALPRVRDVAPAALAEMVLAAGSPLPPRLLTVLGTLAGLDEKLGVPEALVAAVSGHDARSVSTALRALRPIADRVDRRQLFPLLAHEDESIRRRTASLLALAGEAGALWGMIDRADAKAEESGHVLRALMEAGALLAASSRLRQAALAVAAPQLSPKKALENPKSRRDEHLSTARVIAAKFRNAQKPEVSPIAREIAEASDGHVLAPQVAQSSDALDLDRRATDDARAPVAVSATALHVRKGKPGARPRPALPLPALAGIGVLMLLALVLWMRPASMPEPAVNVGVGKIVPGPKDLPANEMAVEQVEGFVTVGETPAQAEPLRKRGKLVYGEVLESDATGTATLVDRAGNRLQLAPKSRVQVQAEPASAGARPRFVLVEPEGDVTLDVRAAGDVPLTIAGRTVTLSRAVVRVTGSGPERSVHVKGGDATFFDTSGAVLRARGGFSIALDAAGKGTLEKDVVDSRAR